MGVYDRMETSSEEVMNEALYYSLLGFAYCGLFSFMAKGVYGSWPWESRKTWYWTGPEIEYLRELKYPATTRLLRDRTPTEQPK